MATPNYGYEKRQKELAKKRKREDKLRAKAERKTGPADGSEAPSDAPDEVAQDDPEAPGSSVNANASGSQ